MVNPSDSPTEGINKEMFPIATCSSVGTSQSYLKRQHRNRDAGENECCFENVNGTALNCKDFGGEVKANHLSYINLIELCPE